jgi:hypothetical protein
MRIGIDARELCGQPTGVGRHLAGLLAAWQDSPRAQRHTFVLFTPEKGAVLIFPKNEYGTFFGEGGSLSVRRTIPKSSSAQSA